MQKSGKKRSSSNEQRVLRPRLEVKEEAGFCKNDVKKALLESLYEQQKEERRKEFEEELKRREEAVRRRFEAEQRKKAKAKLLANREKTKRVKKFEVKKGKQKETINDFVIKSGESSKRKEKLNKVQETEVKIGEKGRYSGVKSKGATKDSAEVTSGAQKEKVREIPEELKAGVSTERVSERKERVKKDLNIEALPSTTDFIRFISLDYTNGIATFSCATVGANLGTVMLKIEQMNGEFAHLINIAFLGISFFISLLLFQHGFLLKRIELTSRSACSDVASTRDACWVPARYRRIVIILIDALRYDFVAPLLPMDRGNTGNAYSGHLPTITRLLNDHNESAILMHFKADPPTTTMQRLKALTTGSLPTFIDVGSNFASSAIVEDNWIDQLVATNRSVVMLGDDTWVSLYPKQFLRSYHMPSFDVNDLHTVDKMILNDLYDELVESDWTVLIAHFLGVDHCGHKYGPNHREMSKKLKQMDEMLAKVTDFLDNETLLIVMGDHGMTDNGDHGGDEPQETDAALFMYSKKQLIFAEPPETISQVDIVPTISLLIDLPIPYSNIGTLIDCTVAPKHRSLAVSSNAEQMMRYGRTVVAETQMPELDLLIRNFEAHGNLENSIDYMRTLQSLLRFSWTEFDDSFMRIGFLSLLDAVLAVYDSLYTGNISLTSLIFRSGLFFIQASAFLIGGEEHYIAILDFLLSFSLIVRFIRTIRTLFSFTSTTSDIVVFCIIVAHAISFLSNSYIVFESSVSRFLTQTIVAIAFWQSFSDRRRDRRQRPKSFFDVLKCRFGWQRFADFVTIIFILRLGILFEKCREEQQNACEATIFSQSFARIPHGVSKILRFVLGMSAQIVAASETTDFLRNHPSEIWNSSLIFPLTVAIIASWMSQWLPEHAVGRFANFSLATAQIVYLLSFISILIVCFNANQTGKSWNPYGCSISYLISISAVLLLILGDGLAFSFVSLIVAIILIPRIIDDEHYQLSFLVLLSSHGFFALSHQPTFSTIPWQAAFVGIPGNFAVQSIPATLVIAHIFASQIITCAALPMLVTQQNRQQFGLAHWSYKLLFFHSLKALSVCAMAAIHRRHLMVWKIFAPKFIFESLSLCVVCITLFVTNCIFRKLLVLSPSPSPLPSALSPIHHRCGTKVN